MSVQELREKRAEIAKRIRELADIANDDKQEWTAEYEEQFKDANKDYDDLTRKIEIAERAEQVQKEIDEVQERVMASDKEVRPDIPDEKSNVITLEDRANALQGWLRVQSGLDPEERHLEAAKKTGVNLYRNSLDINLETDYRKVLREYRAYESTSAGAGGETIPAGFVNQFEQALLQYGGVRGVATVIRTASGNQLTYPTANDTGNVGALLAENTQVSEQNVATSSLTLDAYKYTSKLVRVSTELLEDSAFNLVNWLGAVLGERIGRALAAAFATGTGSSQPNGIVTASTAGVTAASTTAITADELIGLYHSVDPAYRVNATWMMHDNVILAIRKLKDGDNQYLWQPGLQAGVPDRLLGAPVIVNQQMASTIEASAKTVLFGQMSKYIIRDVASLRLLRLVERYADYDQQGFVAFSRHDGDLLDAGTHPVKHLVQAAS